MSAEGEGGEGGIDVGSIEWGRNCLEMRDSGGGRYSLLLLLGCHRMQVRREKYTAGTQIRTVKLHLVE